MRVSTRFFAMFCAVLLVGAAKAQTSPPACAGTDAGVQLTVQVAGIRAAEGQVAITIYPDDPDRFLASGGKLARQRVTAVAPVTEACFNLPAAGYYAIAIYHDANANRDFDRTLLGFPDEGFGFSNDPETTIGLPSFKEVRFSVKAGANAIRIQTRYP